jgi:hypothetical protein
LALSAGGRVRIVQAIVDDGGYGLAFVRIEVKVRLARLANSCARVVSAMENSDRIGLTYLAVFAIRLISTAVQTGSCRVFQAIALQAVKAILSQYAIIVAVLFAVCDRKHISHAKSPQQCGSIYDIVDRLGYVSVGLCLGTGNAFEPAESETGARILGCFEAVSVDRRHREAEFVAVHIRAENESVFAGSARLRIFG